MNDKRDVIRHTDAEAILLAKTLLRTARHGAIAVLDPESGRPLASRVGVATDLDGTPLILISLLAAHTRALIADPRCSLLLGEPGKGDALAHPRITLFCHAEVLAKSGVAYPHAERRYLNRNPKARLYAGLGDFGLYRLAVDGASLNGGFGKAYALTAQELVTESLAIPGLLATEQGAVDHMNADHRDAIDAYARQLAGAKGDGWRMTGIDPDGFDLAAGDEVARVFFPAPLSDSSEMRKTLVDMAKAARSLDRQNLDQGLKQ